MDWTGQIDAYCERTDATMWSEPINAATNIAFVIAALVMARRLQGTQLPLAWGLVVILAAIGVGSFLFHTFATQWASVADVLPILLFILLYLFVANLHFWRLPLWGAILLTIAFFPYTAALYPLLSKVSWLGSSAGYVPVLLLITAYGLALRANTSRRSAATANGLLIGAALLALSLVSRTADMAVCDVWPYGTHFLWHCLNALMLGWMIEVYRRHAVQCLAGAPTQR